MKNLSIVISLIIFTTILCSCAQRTAIQSQFGIVRTDSTVKKDKNSPQETTALNNNTEQINKDNSKNTDNPDIVEDTGSSNAILIDNNEKMPEGSIYIGDPIPGERVPFFSQKIYFSDLIAEISVNNELIAYRSEGDLRKTYYNITLKKVYKTKEGLHENQEITVLVDSTNYGGRVNKLNNGDSYILILCKSDDEPDIYNLEASFYEAYKILKFENNDIAAKTSVIEVELIDIECSGEVKDRIIGSLPENQSKDYVQFIPKDLLEQRLLSAIGQG